ncbi:hypothetical protein [Bacillus toyonensis]|uniref:hypothetical protein n=1 Tax=Bacillus toyonensis TaxID=155322 RepID=UPI00027BEAB1|nr:hypothetical protein [Bacillus toyonensis]EJV41785.1 hypothetical protein IEA_05670 [Bacillus toyonensis]
MKNTKIEYLEFNLTKVEDVKIYLAALEKLKEQGFECQILNREDDIVVVEFEKVSCEL